MATVSARIALRFLHELAKRLAQRVGVEVARADDVEACGLQGLGDQAGIVGRGRKRRLCVGAVADHERDALFLLLRRRLEPSAWQGEGQEQAERKNGNLPARRMASPSSSSSERRDPAPPELNGA